MLFFIFRQQYQFSEILFGRYMAIELEALPQQTRDLCKLKIERAVFLAKYPSYDGSPADLAIPGVQSGGPDDSLFGLNIPGGNQMQNNSNSIVHNNSMPQ